MNPIEILKGFMGKGGNPQELVMRALNIAGNNNPMISNLVNMAKNGNKQNIEQFARNICKSKGIDFDTQFADFMKQLKG